MEDYDDVENVHILGLPNQHFTLEQFDAWVAKSIKAWRAALVAYGDVFVESKTKQVDKPKASTAKVLHSIDLGANDIKHNHHTRILLITDIQKFKHEGVTDLQITFNDYRDAASTYIACIPITDLTQKSLQITLEYNRHTYSYVPNIKTRWGSFFRLIKDKVT